MLGIQSLRDCTKKVEMKAAVHTSLLSSYGSSQ